MKRTPHGSISGFLVASLTLAGVAAAQGISRPAPALADWEALAKLPDFSGVWETGLGGGGMRHIFVSSPYSASVRKRSIKPGSGRSQLKCARGAVTA